MLAIPFAFSLEGRYDEYAIPMGKSMLTQVSKWGHSLAVRIPRQLAASYGIEEGTALEISGLDGGRLELRPTGPTLDELVRRITPENRHDEVATGEPVGRELL